MPTASVAIASTVIVYCVPYASGEVQMNIIVVRYQLVTPLMIGNAENAPSVAVRSMGSLKVTEMIGHIETLVPVGELSITVGGVVSGTEVVVNCQE